MKEFIISILETLGLGKNGVMTNDAQLFAGRLNELCKVSVSLIGITNDKVSFRIGNGKESFRINYRLSGRRIVSLEIPD